MDAFLGYLRSAVDSMAPYVPDGLPLLGKDQEKSDADQTDESKPDADKAPAAAAAAANNAPAAPASAADVSQDTTTTRPAISPTKLARAKRACLTFILGWLAIEVIVGIIAGVSASVALTSGDALTAGGGVNATLRAAEQPTGNENLIANFIAEHCEELYIGVDPTGTDPCASIMGADHHGRRLFPPLVIAGLVAGTFAVGTTATVAYMRVVVPRLPPQIAAPFTFQQPEQLFIPASEDVIRLHVRPRSDGVANGRVRIGLRCPASSWAKVLVLVSLTNQDLYEPMLLVQDNVGCANERLSGVSTIDTAEEKGLRCTSSAPSGEHPTVWVEVLPTFFVFTKFSLSKAKEFGSYRNMYELPDMTSSVVPEMEYLFDWLQDNRRPDFPLPPWPLPPPTPPPSAPPALPPPQLDPFPTSWLYFLLFVCAAFSIMACALLVHRNAHRPWKLLRPDPDGRVEPPPVPSSVALTIRADPAPLTPPPPPPPAPPPLPWAAASLGAVVRVLL